MPFSIKRLSTAVLFAVTLGTASALSYAQSTPPAAPAAPEVVQPTDEELERYIGAAQKVAAVAQEYQPRSEEHTSELQSRGHLVCRLLLEKKNKHIHSKCV